MRLNSTPPPCSRGCATPTSRIESQLPPGVQVAQVGIAVVVDIWRIVNSLPVTARLLISACMTLYDCWNTPLLPSNVLFNLWSLC